MGSLTALRCGPIVTSRLPWKVSGVTVAGSTAGPDSRRAIDSEVSRTGSSPKAFDSRMRIARPPTVGRTIMRKLWSAAGGNLALTGGTPHAASQVPVAPSVGRTARPNNKRLTKDTTSATAGHTRPR